jgi:hypothetical protein
MGTLGAVNLPQLVAQAERFADHILLETETATLVKELTRTCKSLSNPDTRHLWFQISDKSSVLSLDIHQNEELGISLAWTPPLTTRRCSLVQQQRAKLRTEVENLDAHGESAFPATKGRAKERKPNTKILARLLCCCNMDT